VSYTEQAVEDRTVTPSPCAEFPNDNPALHLGAIWRCLELTGAATCELPAPAAVAEIVVRVEAEVEVQVEAEAEEDELDAEALADEAPPIRVITVAPEPVVLSTPEAVVEPPTDPTPPVLEADDEGDDIEIVDELSFDEVVEESPAPEVVGEPATDDPFVALAEVLESVARGAGAAEGAIASLRIVLGRERVTAETGDELLVLREQAAAWQGILRGDSEDFGACGVSSLDEWSSIAVARCMGEMARADGLRRELRRRGVAAFGLVIEAA